MLEKIIHFKTAISFGNFYMCLEKEECKKFMPATSVIATTNLIFVFLQVQSCI